MRYHKHLLMACTEALFGVFFEDRHADKSIEYYLRNNKKWGSRDRRFFAETVYDCVRWWSLYWALLKRQPEKPDFSLLAVSFWRRGLPLPEWEEFQKLSPETFQRRWDQLTDPALKNAFPPWLFERVAAELGKDWLKLAPYFNQVNDLILRVNTSKIQKGHLIKELHKLDIDAHSLLGTETGVRIKKRVNVFRTDLFKKGFFEVQDGSSQQVAPFMDIEPGMRVVDACAGAGGKSLHIADLMKNRGKVISLDIHQWKLDQLKLRARRNSYSNIEMKLIEGRKTIKRLQKSADRVLLDVPCSGLGVLRRNPDTKWKISQKSLDEVIELQSQILQDYSVMLRSGGKLLYSTCSVLPSENDQQVEKFLQKNSEYSLIKKRSLYPTRPGYDGFFMALLQKD